MPKSGLFTLLALALAIVAGCATIADVDKAKASWHGATYDEVVTSWGQPASQTTLRTGFRGTRGSRRVPDMEAQVGAYGGSGGGGVGISLPLPGMGGTVSGHCQRTLSFKDGRVVGPSLAGNDAVLQYLHPVLTKGPRVAAGEAAER